MLDWPTKKQHYEDDADFYLRIFRWAMSHFAYDSDEDVWNEPDHWDSLEDLESLVVAKGRIVGDCDDFAQLCRHALAKLDIPTRLVICTVENGGLHCVAETPEGWVFDNRQQGIVAWPHLLSVEYKKIKFGPLVKANEPMDIDTIPWFAEVERG
jgi:hypothetical protein